MHVCISPDLIEVDQSSGPQWQMCHVDQQTRNTSVMCTPESGCGKIRLYINITHYIKGGGEGGMEVHEMMGTTPMLPLRPTRQREANDIYLA